jgi:5'-3' exonuclease
MIGKGKYMILVDVSSILHRMIFGSTKDSSKFTIIDGKYKTEDFIKLTMHYILSELIDIQIKYSNYGEVVLCFDDYKKEYWRRDIYHEYKLSRRVSSQKSENPVNYKEVYSYTNELFEQLKNNTPWKCVYVNRAEADDIILILAKEFYQEGVLILSPDKDFLQAQRLPNIKQYSALTKKWLVAEDKHDNMDHWIFKHCMLGDVSDGVPKVLKLF